MNDPRQEFDRSMGRAKDATYSDAVYAANIRIRRLILRQVTSARMHAHTHTHTHTCAQTDVCVRNRVWARRAPECAASALDGWDIPIELAADLIDFG